MVVGLALDSHSVELGNTMGLDGPDKQWSLEGPLCAVRRPDLVAKIFRPARQPGIPPDALELTR